jgi:hypothetical protein
VISPLIVANLDGRWTATCVSDRCDGPHDVPADGNTVRAAEAAAHRHLKELSAAAAIRQDLKKVIGVLAEALENDRAERLAAT